MLKHYRIVSRLGEGGMGVVYRAEDTRLGRTVALKVLPRDLAADEERSRRFEREARAASAITHPGIATLFDFDREGENAFLTMEFVEGKTLRRLLSDGPLPTPQLLDCAAQVAEALATAHGKGVVHRDLKPENVMASDSGFFKILDFGLARISPGAPDEQTPSQTQADTVSQEVTKEGKVIGTIAYMSPEQAQGHPVDARCDIFSFGSLLYELATGRAPFKRNNAIATFHAIVHEEPEPLGDLRPDLPPELERIVVKCLAKSAGERYQTAADLAVDLRTLRRNGESGSRSAPGLAAYAAGATPARRWPIGLGILAVAVVAVVAIITFTGRQDGDAAAPWGGGIEAAEGDFVPAGRNRIAVAHFTNNSGEAEADWLCRGLPDMLTTDLARSEGLEVISTQRLYDLMAQEGRTDRTALDGSTATELARRAGAGVVISGSIFKADEDYRIDVQAYDTNTGQVVTAANVSGRDVFQMVDWLSADLRRGLQLAADGDGDIRTYTTSSEEAYRLYTRGMERYEEIRLTEAAEEFAHSLEADPDFALAQLRLGMSLYMLGKKTEGLPHIDRAATQAARLPRRERLLVEAFHAFFSRQDYRTGEASLRELVERYPQDKEGYFWHAQAQAVLAGDREGAIRMFRQVLELDPGYGLAVTSLAGHLILLERQDEAKTLLKGHLADYPDAYGPRLLLVELLHGRGDYDASMAELERIAQHTPEEQDHLIWRPLILIDRGDFAGARACFQGLVEAEDPHLAIRGHRGLALVSLSRGRFREAVDDLERALAVAVEVEDTRAQAGIFRELGGVLAECGEFDRAVRSYQEAVAIDPTGLGILGLSGVYLRKGDFEAATSTWAGIEEAIRPRITPEMLEQFRAAHRAETAFYRGEYEAAETSFRQARSLSGLPTAYAFYLGRALQGQDRHEEAITEFRHLVRPSLEVRRPIRSIEAIYYLARSLDAAGHSIEALEAYRDFLLHWGDGERDLHADMVGEARSRVASLQA